MFNHKKNRPAKNSSTNQPEEPTTNETTAAQPKQAIEAFIGVGSTLQGTFRFNETVRIDGHFEGEIISDGTLIAGETATIEGKITIGNLILSGTLKGTVTASRGIELRQQACLEADISTPQLKVAEQATLKGEIKMSGQSDPDNVHRLSVVEQLPEK